ERVGPGVLEPVQDGGVVDAVGVGGGDAVLGDAGGGARGHQGRRGGAGRGPGAVEQDRVVVDPRGGAGHGVDGDEEALPPVVGAVVVPVEGRAGQRRGGGDDVGTARVGRPDEEGLAPVAGALGVAVERAADALVARGLEADVRVGAAGEGGHALGGGG